MSKIIPGAEDFFYEGNTIGILVIHGFTGTPQSMHSLGSGFADAGFTVLAPRLTGHGISPEEMTKAHFKDWLQDVEEALDELRLYADKIFVTGLSMGGTLALFLAENYADILGVIPINAVVNLSHLTNIFQTENSEYILIMPDIKKPGVIELGYRKASIKSLKELRDLIPEVQHNLGQINCPTLIFSSTIDHVVPPHNSTDILQGINSQDKTLIMLHNSYHLATLDHDADLIVTESIKFIQKTLASEI